MPILLQKAENVGNMNFTLTYNPSIAEVVRVDRGGLMSGALFQSNPGVPGTIQFGFAATGGVNDSGSVAVVEFRGVGPQGSSTLLTLTTTQADDTAGAPIGISTRFGVLTIEQRASGDGDGDGKVTEVDALMALQMSVGLRPENLVLDVDDDGGVTSADARILLKQAVSGRTVTTRRRGGGPTAAPGTVQQMVQEFAQELQTNFGTAIVTNSTEITAENRERVLNELLENWTVAFGTGDSSIQMPNGAISSREMSNEPGAVTTSTNGSCGFFCSNCVVQTTSVGTVHSRTINLPASGYILAIASAEVNLFHTTGTRSSVHVGVSPTTSFQYAQDSVVSIPGAAPTGTYTQLVTTHGIFGPYSGSITVRLLAQESASSVSSSICDRTLTAVYLPTAYYPGRGEDDTTREGHDDSDIDFEQEAWIYVNEQGDSEVSSESASIAELSRSEADRLGLRFLELEREMANLRQQLIQAAGDTSEED